MCKHVNTIELDERCYTGPVSDTESRVTQGGVTWLEVCRDCSATRVVNSNAMRRAYSDWGHDARNENGVGSVFFPGDGWHPTCEACAKIESLHVVDVEHDPNESDSNCHVCGHYLT